MGGAGTAGPAGELDNERAGDPGEYHHSKNLIKKIVVGNKNLKESKMARGEFAKDLYNLAMMSRVRSGSASCCAPLESYRTLLSR